MTVRSTFTLGGIDKYLEEIQRAGSDIDAVVADAIQEAAPIVEKQMHDLLRKSSETWTGGIDLTIEASEVQQEGNFIFVEIGVNGNDEGAFSKEFGTPRQAAEPFVRPAFTRARHLWRNAVKAALMRYLE